MKDSCRDVYCEAVTNILVFFTSSSFSSFESEKYGFLVSPRSQKYTYWDSGNRVYLVLVQSPSTLEVLCFDLFMISSHFWSFIDQDLCLMHRKVVFLFVHWTRPTLKKSGCQSLWQVWYSLRTLWVRLDKANYFYRLQRSDLVEVRFESHVLFLVSSQASNRLSGRDARKRWPLRFMMEGHVLLPESNLSGWRFGSCRSVEIGVTVSWLGSVGRIHSRA